ncbi:GNAT family N-acetyltransferase [Alsobacter sp. R-9]
MFPEITRDDVFRLETRRLWLRWPRAKDAAAIAAMAGKREVADMTARIPHPYPAHGAEEWIVNARRANAEGWAVELVACLATGSRQVIGSVSARWTDEGRVEIGYVFAPEMWGQGYATEAVQALVDAVFMLTRADAVVADVRVINPASQGVLRKCGFAWEGSGLKELPARGGLHSVEHFRLERKVWRSLKGWAAPDLVARPPRHRDADGGQVRAWSEASPAA